jgi:hypothetical protein
MCGAAYFMPNLGSPVEATTPRNINLICLRDVSLCRCKTKLKFSSKMLSYSSTDYTVLNEYLMERKTSDYSVFEITRCEAFNCFL